MLFAGNPRYENVPLIGRGSPPPSVCQVKIVRHAVVKLIFNQVHTSVYTEIINMKQCFSTGTRLPPAGCREKL